MDVTRHGFELKGGAKDGSFAGIASAYGLPIPGWESTMVIAPGAFASAIPGFLARGFVPEGHDWDRYSDVVAMPTMVEDRPEGLYMEAQFHSTDKAQDARQVCSDRLNAGLAVCLSVAFSIGGKEEYASGPVMLEALQAQGRMTDAYDTERIKALAGTVALVTHVSELYEVSLVPVPANKGAMVTVVNSAPQQGLTLQAELDAALAAVESVAHRLEEVVRLRRASGRDVSQSSLDLAKRLAALLSAAAESRTETGPDQVATLQARATAALEVARTALVRN